METKNREGELTSGKNISFWTDTVEPVAFSQLFQEIRTDVLIIGGGISGLSTAYYLLKAGRSVTLVEDGLIGSGETGRTTAHLSCALDDRYYEIEKAFGAEKAKTAAASHMAAIDAIETIVREENIDCDFERLDGYLFLHPSDKLENLEKEFEATQRAGINTEWVATIPSITGVQSPAIRFPGQAQFHIMKYISGLARAVAAMGAEIYTNTRAMDITEKGATCNGYKVVADHIVVATNTPVNDFFTIHTKQYPYRTYVIGAKVRKGTYPHTLWWDTGNMKSTWVTAPYHYVRLNNYDEQYDILIVGGEDHKTGQADTEGIPESQRFPALLEWTRKHFPAIEDVVYEWSGQVMEPVDYMGYIGKNPGNKDVYIITGDSGNGMTHGTLAGILISDLINKKDNDWVDLYSPSRMPLRTPVPFLQEMGNTFKQYADYVKKGDIQGLEELPPATGAILGKGLKKYAVYRDQNNQVQAFSAICPHMGCVVQWNDTEESFDCPCHGSRFTKEGNVINGPTSHNLAKVNLEE